MLGAVFWLASEIIHLLVLAIIADVVLSLLISFDVVNLRNRFVYMVGNALNRITEPLLRPIRRVVPYLGNLDVSPLIAILILQALQIALTSLYAHIAMSGLAF